MLKKLRYQFQVGADDVRALDKRSLELIQSKMLDIDYKHLKIQKVKLEVEKLQHEKKVI